MIPKKKRLLLTFIILHSVAEIPFTYGVLTGATIVILHTYIGGIEAISEHFSSFAVFINDQYPLPDLEVVENNKLCYFST